MGNILDGKLVSTKIKEELAVKCDKLLHKYSIAPKLAIVLVGENPASLIYVSSKEKSCAQVGITSLTVRLPETVTQSELNNEIIKNQDRFNKEIKINNDLELKSRLEELLEETKEYHGL